MTVRIKLACSELPVYLAVRETRERPHPKSSTVTPVVYKNAFYRCTYACTTKMHFFFTTLAKSI